jgi:hypothetical protein
MVDRLVKDTLDSFSFLFEDHFFDIELKGLAAKIETDIFIKAVKTDSSMELSQLNVLESRAF